MLDNVHINVYGKINAHYICRMDIIVGEFKYDLEDIAKYDYFAMLKWVVNNDLCDEPLIEQIAKRENLHMLKWIYNNTKEFDVLTIVESSGNLKAAKWGYSIDPNPNVINTIYGGNLELVKYAHKLNYCEDAMDCVAGLGHLHILIWMHNNTALKCTTYAIDEAACNGHYEVICWLLMHQKSGYTTNAISNAALNGHLNIIKLLPIKYTKQHINNAICGGQMEVVQYFHKHAPECFDHTAIDLAIRLKRNELAKWLCENRTDGYLYASQYAKKYNPTMVEWLDQHKPHNARV